MWVANGVKYVFEIWLDSPYLINHMDVRIVKDMICAGLLYKAEVSRTARRDDIEILQLCELNCVEADAG
jgi:hypothetical protein